MARSPLVSLFRRARVVIREAHRLGVPAVEHLERLEHDAMTRRHLLGSAAAAVPLLAAACTPGEGSSSSSTSSSSSGGTGQARVVIVGAGMAGLHAAHRLKQAGLEADLYEASNRVGGRIFSDRMTFGAQGQHCELGGELIDTGHATMQDLAAEFSLPLWDFSTDAAPTKLVAYLGGRVVPLNELITSFEPIAAQMDADLATLTDQEDLFVYYNKPNGGAALDALSIRAWLDLHQFSGVARQLLEIAFNIEYGLETDQQNVLNMLFLIDTDTSGGALNLFGESDERYRLQGGNDALITALSGTLDSGRIHTGHRLTSLAKQADGSTTLTFAVDAGTHEVTADHVVLSLPFTMLRNVTLNGYTLPPAKSLAIQQMGYGTNAKLMVGFSSRPWRTTGMSDGSSYTDTGYQATWETSREQAGAAGIITNFTGGNHGVALGMGTPESQRDAFVAEFNAVFPGTAAAANGAVARFHWPSHPHTLGSYACYKVGQYTAMAGVEVEPVENLHFCGEHTSLDAQGYMEGAALTGAMAADEVLTALGLATMNAAPAGFGGVLTPAQRIMERARRARIHRRLRRRTAR